jgi:hypothetical protein
MGRHKTAELRESSGRMNLCLAAHIHHTERLDLAEPAELIYKLLKHATQDKCVVEVEWEQPGDLTNSQQVMFCLHGARSLKHWCVVGSMFEKDVEIDKY